MVVRRGSAGRGVAAAPDAVFAAVVDVDRLPEWGSILRQHVPSSIRDRALQREVPAPVAAIGAIVGGGRS